MMQRRKMEEREILYFLGVLLGVCVEGGGSIFLSILLHAHNND